MEPGRCYATLVSYPIVAVFVFHWIDGRPKRGSDGTFLVASPERRARREVTGRKLILVRLVLLFPLPWWINRSDFSRVFSGTSANIGAAVLGGLLMAAALLFASRLLAPPNGYFATGPVGLWMAIFFVGAPVEEIWRALCINDFQQLGWEPWQAWGLIAVVFAIAHMAGLPSRILTSGFPFEVVVGFGLAATYVRVGSIVAPVVCSVAYFSVSFLLARRMFDLGDSSSG